MLIDFRQLFPKYNIKPKGVLHIGANVGEEAPVYLELGIKHQVWFEANEDIYPTLKANIANNPQAEAWNYCLGDEEGKVVSFNISNNGSQSSSILELGTHLTAHPEVHYIDRRRKELHRYDLIAESNTAAYHFKELDFLNIDVQGAELKVLKGICFKLHQFKWAYLEVNKEELYKGCALVGEIDEYLSGFGFRRVETKWAGNTGWGDALYIK